MLHRFSSRRANLHESFLQQRLLGAQRYDRIAGYFQSSLLDLVHAELAAIPCVRIVCNTEVSAADVQTVRMATGPRRRKLEESLLRLAWNAGRFHQLIDIHGEPVQQRLSALHQLPFTQWIIKRSRERLEAEGKLVKIEMIAYGDGQPILCSHRIAQAFALAEDFAKALHRRVKAGGFIKTLLQRRAGSSLAAGLKTANRMLAGQPAADDEDPDDDSNALYPLTAAERDLLTRLRDHLEAHLAQEDDPKFERVREVLNLDFDGQKWLERGVLIFSQFYDSAYALAEYLSRHFTLPIGLYASSSASVLFAGGQAQRVNRELLKEKVAQGRLKLLIGTDAASTGLNLQQLGCLINLDLPWNPMILEQRKGRLQRGTLAKRIPFYNLRYDQGVEQQLFNTLSGRIQEITAIFGTVPDFIVDRWITDMLEDRRWDEHTILTLIAERQDNPFTLKETTESLDADWESTAEVLNQLDAFDQLAMGW